MKKFVVSGYMSNNLYYSGGLTHAHALQDYFINKLILKEVTKLKLSKKYVVSSILLVNDFNSDNVDEWSFSHNGWDQNQDKIQDLNQDLNPDLSQDQSIWISRNTSETKYITTRDPNPDGDDDYIYTTMPLNPRPLYYITKNIPHNKFTPCNNELILKGLGAQSITNIDNLVCYEDDDIGILFKFSTNIDTSLFKFLDKKTFDTYLSYLSEQKRKIN